MCSSKIAFAIGTSAGRAVAEGNGRIVGERLGRGVAVLGLLAQRLQHDVVEIACQPPLQFGIRCGRTRVGDQVVTEQQGEPLVRGAGPAGGASAGQDNSKRQGQSQGPGDQR